MDGGGVGRTGMTSVGEAKTMKRREAVVRSVEGYIVVVGNGNGTRSWKRDVSIQ